MRSGETGREGFGENDTLSLFLIWRGEDFFRESFPPYVYIIVLLFFIGAGRKTRDKNSVVSCPFASQMSNYRQFSL